MKSMICCLYCPAKAYSLPMDHTLDCPLYDDGIVDRCLSCGRAPDQPHAEGCPETIEEEE